MKKIALVTEFFYPTTGGTQTAVAHIAHSLSQRGYDVTVFAPLPTVNQPDQPSSHYTTIWLPAHISLLPPYIQIQARLIRLLPAYDLIHLFHPVLLALAFCWPGVCSLLPRLSSPLWDMIPTVFTICAIQNDGLHNGYANRPMF
jgi:hypothetical protein